MLHGIPAWAILYRSTTNRSTIAWQALLFDMVTSACEATYWFIACQALPAPRGVIGVMASSANGAKLIYNTILLW